MELKTGERSATHKIFNKNNHARNTAKPKQEQSINV